MSLFQLYQVVMSCGEDWDILISTRRHEIYNGILFSSLVSPPQEVWDEEPRRVVNANLTQVTLQEIADFFSLKAGSISFKQFIKNEIQSQAKREAIARK